VGWRERRGGISKKSVILREVLIRGRGGKKRSVERSQLGKHEREEVG